ncbi:putative regulatory protein, FmdB family [Thermanaeromonas toyohensis ToBE]|uniref:Putative regulatory protein, FmdB family n=1 Tax=Thermanaeromonas toyohensis ToBE TaxID=698762 RepID=A0A1W1VLS1_9FIRM|nr:zinc ribbon domain-containing protein [Thermanaeromonas toyohensis]SMB94266.1 putative regulatory protein, FmdB family [Thermanaeromonas toyohensis ToBE]
MPLYEFRCKECGEKFTMRLSWQEKDKAVCPSCGAQNLQQLFTGITILGSSPKGSSCSAPSGSRFS